MVAGVPSRRGSESGHEDTFCNFISIICPKHKRSGFIDVVDGKRERETMNEEIYR